ncbi:MAG TPA: class I SAM-dependent methyltransferase [Candidatus Acidoferrales bacterium]|nr:class I SAM-dependent methyltransferase [Candidatus Acidoferrales bacterium]
MLQHHQQDWDELAKLDPLWAVLSDPSRRFGRWDHNEFFRSGEDLVEKVVQTAARHGLPGGHDRALDFGCGVGRLTRALGAHFGNCCGVDISRQMIGHARSLNSSVRNCFFMVNSDPHLGIFSSEHFDCVLSILVLQHLPRREWIRSAISEFVRVLKRRGLLVFQLPSFIPWRNRLQPRRRAYQMLRRAGFGHDFLYQSLGLNPIRMTYVKRDDVVALVSRAGAQVVLDETQTVVQKGLIQSTTYYVTK